MPQTPTYCQQNETTLQTMSRVCERPLFRRARSQLAVRKLIHANSTSVFVRKRYYLKYKTPNFHLVIVIRALPTTTTSSASQPMATQGMRSKIHVWRNETSWNKCPLGIRAFKRLTCRKLNGVHRWRKKLYWVEQDYASMTFKKRLCEWQLILLFATKTSIIKSSTKSFNLCTTQYAAEYWWCR